MDFEQWHKHNLIRLYDEVSKISSEGKHGEVFKREYQRCYLVSRQYEPFTVIKYKDVLILYMLKELFGKYQKVEIVLERLTAILTYKFHHSHRKEINNYEVNSNFNAETIIGWGLTGGLIEKISKVAAIEQVCMQKEKQGLESPEREEMRKMRQRRPDPSKEPIHKIIQPVLIERETTLRVKSDRE